MPHPVATSTISSEEKGFLSRELHFLSDSLFFLIWSAHLIGVYIDCRSNQLEDILADTDRWLIDQSTLNCDGMDLFSPR